MDGHREGGPRPWGFEQFRWLFKQKVFWSCSDWRRCEGPPTQSGAPTPGAHLGVQLGHPPRTASSPRNPLGLGAVRAPLLIPNPGHTAKESPAGSGPAFLSLLPFHGTFPAACPGRLPPGKRLREEVGSRRCQPGGGHTRVSLGAAPSQLPPHRGGSPPFSPPLSVCPFSL